MNSSVEIDEHGIAKVMSAPFEFAHKLGHPEIWEYENQPIMIRFKELLGARRMVFRGPDIDSDPMGSLYEMGWGPTSLLRATMTTVSPLLPFWMYVASVRDASADGIVLQDVKNKRTPDLNSISQTLEREGFGNGIKILTGKE